MVCIYIYHPPRKSLSFAVPWLHTILPLNASSGCDPNNPPRTSPAHPFPSLPFQSKRTLPDLNFMPGGRREVPGLGYWDAENIKETKRYRNCACQVLCAANCLFTGGWEIQNTLVRLSQERHEPSPKVFPSCRPRGELRYRWAKMLVVCIVFRLC